MRLFTYAPGRAVELSMPHAVGSITVASVRGTDNEPVTFQTHKTIITKIGISLAGNYQFLHAIGNDVYVYVFGDRMGQIVLHCLSFTPSCPGRETSGLHGFAELFEWYRKNRIAKSQDLVTITIAGIAFEGFLIGSTPEFSDAETRISQTQLVFSLLPSMD